MGTMLLQTKLYTPRVRPTLIPRPRLITKLDEGLTRRITLISAPAGFGKTTLVASWLQQHERPTAWIALEEGDNDPAWFLLYLAAALQHINISSAAVELILDRSIGMVLSDATLTAVINDIANQTQEFILVLDDYHLISNQEIHQALKFLVDHLPRQMHLVIVTRADLPFPMARLRSRGELSELRQDDLGFTVAEATQFLNRKMGLDLSEGEVAALNRRTEGWIAGLQLAAVSLQGREDHASFVQAFAGSDRYIADYLVEEVLIQQSARMQEFLLKTAVLKRLTAALCAAVSGYSLVEAQRILEELDQANLFVNALDDKREWYRYHRLFTDLLRQRLQLTYSNLIPDLHRRASTWYEVQGVFPEAIDHAFAAADFERAAQLLEETAEATFMRSEAETFLAWCEALPDALLSTHLPLTFYYAWALLQAGRELDRVERYLNILDADGYLEGRVTALRGYLATYHNQMADAAYLTHHALDLIAPDDPFLSHAAAWHTNFTYVDSGDFQANTQALARTAKTGLVAGNITVAIGALCQIARLKKRQGRLQQAETIYRQALDEAADEQGNRLPIAGLALMGLGELSREHNDLDPAVKMLVEGIQVVRQWRSLATLSGYVSLIRARQAQGDEAGADDALAQMKQLAWQSDATKVDDMVADLTAARLAMMRGHVDVAVSWAEERGFDAIAAPIQLEQPGDDILTHLAKYEALVLARVWIAKGRSVDAMAFLLKPLQDWVSQRERTDLQIETLILSSLSWDDQGKRSRAAEALEKGLSLAEPGGYERIFLDEGQGIASLLQGLQLKNQELAPYRLHLLDAFGQERRPILAPTPAHVLIEPLSARELQILQLIAAGLSNREIAQELILSLPTVKWHTSNIYGKLGVKNRTTAVAKARSLQLLASF